MNARSLAQLPVTELKGVGAALQLKLEKLDIHTLQDLLFHLPLRYQNRTRIMPIGSLRPGDEGVIEGEVKGADIVMGRRRSMVCRLQDGTGTVTLRFFHFSAAQKNNLKAGTPDSLLRRGAYRCQRSGDVSSGISSGRR